MSLSLSTNRSSVMVARRGSRCERGIIWGFLAGGTLGFGFILDIDFFAGSAMNLIGAVLIGASVMGATFGHVMAGMLARDVSSSHVYFTRSSQVVSDLSEYRGLRLQIHAQQVSVHIHPASTFHFPAMVAEPVSKSDTLQAKSA